MNNYIDISHIQSLQALSEQIAQNIKKGSQYIIHLQGDLGTGKTTFAQYLLKHLGVRDHISSPSYALVNTYQCHLGAVAHADFYRLDSEDDLDLIGWDIILDESQIVIIEWPQNISKITPNISLDFCIKGEHRYVKIHPSIN